MPVLIAGIGTAVPPHRIGQTEAAELARPYACETAEHDRVFNAVYWGTGVETRHSVVLQGGNHETDARQSFYGDVSPTTCERMHKYEEEANHLATSAARQALDDSAVHPRRITHLVTVSCTGFSAPGFDIALIKNLGLAPDIARTQVGFMGCHGALNGLRVTRAFVEADPRACVLLCAVEMCSLHHQYGWSAEQVVANSLFADGAGAVVTIGGESRSDSHYEVVASGSTVVPESEDAMSWRIGDNGFRMTLSTRVPALIARNLRGWIDNWLGVNGHTVETIGGWAVHPGGPRILAATGEALGIDRGALKMSHAVLAEYGNMSSPTVLFILDRMRRACTPRPWVVLGFGPGLAIEAALLA